MISDLLPHLAELADELCFIHSMTAKTNTHGPAENQMSTGFTLDGFPSIGAWVSYALGSEADDLPAFVAIPDPRGVPQAGPNHWTQRVPAGRVSGHAVQRRQADPEPRAARQRVDAGRIAPRAISLKFLNERHLAKHPGDTELAARIASYELAARMQLSVPAVSDLSTESAATIRGVRRERSRSDCKAASRKNCLLARRLLERGVRFVQLFNGAYAMGEGVGNWDGHKTLKEQYDIHGPILDQPAAALLTT